MLLNGFDSLHAFSYSYINEEMLNKLITFTEIGFFSVVNTIENLKIHFAISFVTSS